MKRMIALVLALVLFCPEDTRGELNRSMAGKQQDQFEQFLAEGRKHFGTTNFLEWSMQNIRIKIGRAWLPFSLKGHEPLREMYTQKRPPREVFRKGAQLAISTYAFLKSLYIGVKYGLSTSYFFPTDEDIADHVQDKANPIIENSPLLSAMQGANLTDNIGLKQFGKFSIYFRGVYSKRKVKSISIDHSVMDEVDESNQENLKFAEDRLLHSSDPAITKLSQPSEDDYGIDADFKESDSRYFGVKCGCGFWNFPDKTFPDCLITKGNNVYIGCVKCSRKLNMNNGVWVAEFPSRSKDIVGRHLSHLLFDHISAAEIKRRHETATTMIQKKNFAISILGFPYSTVNSKPVTDEVLHAAQRQYVPDSHTRFTFWGMDVGDKCHLVFLQPHENRLRVTDFIEMSSDNEKAIIQAVEQRGGYCGVIDAMPYKTLAKNIARHFHGRVYINYYKGDTLKTGEEGQGDFAVPRATVNRDESLDETTEALRDARIELPDSKRMTAEQITMYEVFKSQVKMLIKEGVDNGGINEIHYKKKVANHFGMALNYARIAAELSPVTLSTDVDPIFTTLM